MTDSDYPDWEEKKNNNKNAGSKIKNAKTLSIKKKIHSIKKVPTTKGRKSA